MRNLLVGVLVGAVLAVLVVFVGGTPVRAQGGAVGLFQMSADGTRMLNTTDGKLYRLESTGTAVRWEKLADAPPSH